MKHLEKYWGYLVIIGVIFMTGAGATTWAYAVHQDIAANTMDRLIRTFERLSIIRRHRPLTRTEWLRWCSAGQRMKVFTTCPPRQFLPPPGGRRPS